MGYYLALCVPYEKTYDGLVIPFCKPEFLDSDKREGKIIGARNPIYFSDHSETEMKGLVSNDICWGNNARNTFIQGPNSRGKSFYLNTVALNIFLPMAGLLPFAEFCEMSPIRKIQPCYDLGSMLDGHFVFGGKKVRDMLKNLQRNDIVLCDEAGSGTEPDAEREISKGTLMA